MATATATEQQAIHVENIGIVTDFSFDLPPDGGMVVLKGENGCGKSTVLHTAEVLVTGNGKLSKRDGAPEGRVEGLGCVLKVRRQIRHTGELDIAGVGDLDISDLHTPPYKDPAARDRHRIKTLVRLSGVEADISRFYALVGGREEFDQLVNVAASETTDLVEMAARVKRDLEAASRKVEGQAETATANARAKRDAIAGIDFSRPHDAAALNRALEESLRRKQQLQSEDDAAEQARRRAADARKKLDNAVAGYSGPTAEEARQAEAEKEAAWREKERRTRELAEQLAKAEKESEVAHSEYIAAEHRHADAQRFERLTAEWRETIEAAEKTAGPDGAELIEADCAVNQAREAVEQGVRIRDAIQAKEQADLYAEQAELYREQSGELRAAARSCEDVLSDAVASVAGCPLRVWYDGDGNARLVTATARSERTLFDELSDGERWTLIVPLAVGERRLVVLKQAAFGELQPKNRLLLHRLAQEHRCWILTAQADDGDMRAEVYGEG